MPLYKHRRSLYNIKRGCPGQLFARGIRATLHAALDKAVWKEQVIWIGRLQDVAELARAAGSCKAVGEAVNAAGGVHTWEYVL